MHIGVRSGSRLDRRRRKKRFEESDPALDDLVQRQRPRSGSERLECRRHALLKRRHRLIRRRLVVA